VHEDVRVPRSFRNAILFVRFKKSVRLKMLNGDGGMERASTFVGITRLLSITRRKRSHRVQREAGGAGEER
jgi:hypothetical protein